MVSAGLDPATVAEVLEGDTERVREVVCREFAADPVRRHLRVSPRMVVQVMIPEEEPEKPEEPEREPEPTPPVPAPEPEPERETS